MWEDIATIFTLDLPHSSPQGATKKCVHTEPKLCISNKQMVPSWLNTPTFASQMRIDEGSTDVRFTQRTAFETPTRKDIAKLSHRAIAFWCKTFPMLLAWPRCESLTQQEHLRAATHHRASVPHPRT
jgi:hypothetical protein